MAKYGRFLAAAAMAVTAIGAGLAGAAAPPDGGSISIEAGSGGAPAPTAFAVAAGEALAGKGFTILEDPGHAAYVAELSLSRTEVGTGTARIPAGRGSAGPGGAYGGVGASVALPLPTGNATLVPLERTQLELRIRKRGEEAPVWHGAAVTVRAAGTRTGTDEAVATALSAAILRGYPVEPQGVVGVP